MQAANAGISSKQQEIVLDCRGLQCPTPILRIAEAARQHRGQPILLLIEATDPDFSTDLEAWCRSTRSRILRLQESHGETQATVALNGAQLQPTPLPAPVAPAPAPPEAAALATVTTPAGLMAGEAGQAAPRENLAALLVVRNDLEVLLAAMMVANASASQGMAVEIYFAFWGIHLLRGRQPRATPSEGRQGLLQRLLAWMMPRGPAAQQLGKMHWGGFGTRLLRRFMRQRNVLSLEQMVDACVAQDVRFVVCSMSMGLMGLERRDIVDLPNVSFGGVTAFTEAARRSSVSLVF
jgi:peroxiredoxin family protein/TusA-related sulfurtransferase